MTEMPNVPDVAARYDRVAEAFEARLSALSEPDWKAQTPCAEWDARALVSHVVGTHRWIAATLEGGDPAPVGDDEDLVAEWRRGRALVSAALADEETATRTVDTKAFGEMPFATVVSNVLCGDTVVHTWDLARATGQDETLDPEAVAITHRMLESFGDAIRRPGAFGPEVPVPADADATTRLIAYTGRAV